MIAQRRGEIHSLRLCARPVPLWSREGGIRTCALLHCGPPSHRKGIGDRWNWWAWNDQARAPWNRASDAEWSGTGCSGCGKDGHRKYL